MTPKERAKADLEYYQREIRFLNERRKETKSLLQIYNGKLGVYRAQVARLKAELKSKVAS